MGHEIINEEFFNRIENISLEIKNPLDGLFGGGRKAKGYGNTVEFADYREYVPGDDIKRIDQNVYGRFEKLYIKLFADERQIHNQILIDGSMSMKEKADSVKKLAAAIGYLSVLSLDRVSYKLINGDWLNDLCGVVHGKDSFFMAAKKIEDIEFDKAVNMGEAIMNNDDSGYSDGITFLISDFFTESDFYGAIDFLLYKKREVILIQVLSPEEINPSCAGRIFFLDSESIDECDDRNLKMSVNKNAVRAYKETLKNYENEIKSFCDSRDVSFISLDSSEDILEALFKRGYERGFIK